MICVYVSGHKGVDGIRGVPVSIPARDRNALVGAWGGFGRTTGRVRAYNGSACDGFGRTQRVGL